MKTVLKKSFAASVVWGVEAPCEGPTSRMIWIVTTSKATSVHVSAHAHQPSQQKTNARSQQEKERRRAEAEADTVPSACAPKRSPVEVSVADFCPQSVCIWRAAAEDEREERCTFSRAPKLLHADTRWFSKSGHASDGIWRGPGR